MKTTLVLLVTVLVFLATPMLATAGGRHQQQEQNYHSGRVNMERHDQRRHYHYDNRRDDRYDQKRDHRVKRHLRQELRETRQELRQTKRQIKHNHRRPYYVRSFPPNPAVIFSLPHLVFQFGW